MPELLSQKIVRSGLGLFFVLFSINKFLEPSNWFGYVPSFLSDFLSGFRISLVWFVILLGILEFLLGVCFLFNKKTKFSALIATILIAGVIITQGWNEISIRDVGLFSMALSIFFSSNWSKADLISQLKMRK